jgi:hypothetical protein
MSSAEDVLVQNTSGILALPRFQKCTCMGRVPSDEKIPDDMSDEDKCTVPWYYSMIVCLATGMWLFGMIWGYFAPAVVSSVGIPTL